MQHPPPAISRVSRDVGDRRRCQRCRLLLEGFSFERRGAERGRNYSSPDNDLSLTPGAHGFSVKMIAGLVNEGVATLTREQVLTSGNKTIEVGRARVSDAGRNALRAAGAWGRLPSKPLLGASRPALQFLRPPYAY